MQASLPGRGCPGPARPVSTLRYSSGQVGCKGIIATKREPEGREAAGCDVNAMGKFENGIRSPVTGYAVLGSRSRTLEKVCWLGRDIWLLAWWGGIGMGETSHPAWTRAQHGSVRCMFPAPLRCPSGPPPLSCLDSAFPGFFFSMCARSGEVGKETGVWTDGFGRRRCRQDARWHCERCLSDRCSDHTVRLAVRKQRRDANFKWGCPDPDHITYRMREQQR